MHGFFESLIHDSDLTCDANVYLKSVYLYSNESMKIISTYVEVIPTHVFHKYLHKLLHLLSLLIGGNKEEIFKNAL